MKTATAPNVERIDDVIGIVISRGNHTEAPPRFSMYIWGPSPDADPETTTKAA